MMNYWLVKSEPEVYSWNTFVSDGKSDWNGVRNYAARLHLRAMKKGDLVLWYHSNEGKAIVGIAKVVKEYYPDPSAPDGDWSTVDLKPVKALKQPVTLETIKQEPKLRNMALIKIGRLSVSPVTAEEYEHILSLAKTS